MRTFKERGNAVSNANVPLLSSPTSSFPPISNYSTRLNSAQLTNSSQLSSSYQPSNSTLVTNSSRLSSTNSQDYHLPHNKSGRGGREIFLVEVGSRWSSLPAVVRCVRAHPARLSVAQPRDLSLLRFRRPFADTVGDLSLSTSDPARPTIFDCMPTEPGY